MVFALSGRRRSLGKLPDRRRGYSHGLAAGSGTCSAFYNERRKQVLEAQPNEGHLALARLEACFDVRIITQNIDDLHERAGSSSVFALAWRDPQIKVVPGPLLDLSDRGLGVAHGRTLCKGSQLRPHIVWFGEMVPLLPEAATLFPQPMFSGRWNVTGRLSCCQPGRLRAGSSRTIRS